MVLVQQRYDVPSPASASWMPDKLSVLTPPAAPTVMELYGQLMAHAMALYTQVRNNLVAVSK